MVGRISATRRGYTDAGSVQARAGYEFSAVAHQSVVHRRRVGGARMRNLAALKSSQEYKVSIVCSAREWLQSLCDSCSLDIHVRDIGHATDMNVHPTFDRFGIAAKT